MARARAPGLRLGVRLELVMGGELTWLLALAPQLASPSQVDIYTCSPHLTVLPVPSLWLGGHLHAGPGAALSAHDARAAQQPLPAGAPTPIAQARPRPRPRPRPRSRPRSRPRFKSRARNYALAYFSQLDADADGHVDPTLGDNGALCLTVLQSAFTAALLLLMLRYHHLHHRIARLRKCLLAAAAARAVVAEERWWQRHVHRLYVAAEALVLLIHPMPGDVLPVQLEIFMWLRLYLILRVARDFSTVYVSEYDAPFSWALAINSWLYARPATTVTSSLLLIMGFAAYGTLISERTHVHALRAVGGAEAAAEIDISISGERGLDVSPQTWSESLWLVAIVMTTVGFGDFAPVSFVGRLLTLAAALVGILLSALMISIVQNQLTLSYQQVSWFCTMKIINLTLS